MQKQCTKCKQNKELEDFRHRNKSYPDRGRQSWCKKCMSHYQVSYRPKNPATREHLNKIQRKHRLKKDYGLTPQDYETMLKTQSYLCAICAKHHNAERYGLCVDHDHDTGKIRGLLCRTCNCGIGYLKDDLLLVQNAALYLELDGAIH
jgi:hypothetical protein